MATFLACGFSKAQAAQFLSPNEAMTLLADSKPWNGVRPDGEKTRLTFNPDGTGRFEGPITISTTWTIRGEDVCIHLGFILGTKCVRFRRSGALLEAFEGTDAAFTLSR